MVTMKIEVGKAKRNGGVPVYIRLTQGREHKRIRFYMDANQRDVSENGDILNIKLEMAIQDEMQMYRRKLYDLGADVENMPLDELADYLVNNKEKKVDAFKLDFIKFGREHVEELLKQGQGKKKTAQGYNTAINNFCKFLGKDTLDINKVTKALLVEYMKWLSDNNYGPRASEAYMGALQSLHNLAKKRYNDEDDGLTYIKLSPFSTLEFKRTKAERSVKSKDVKERQTLSPEALLYMYNIPMGMLTQRGAMARDAFFLSFGLCGMNAIDMMMHKQKEGCEEDLIEYYRQKISGRCGEDAFIRMHVHPFFMDIHRRLRGARHTWIFAEKYSDEGTLTAALNIGLGNVKDAAVVYYGKQFDLDPLTNRNEILNRIGLNDNFTFYAARHTFASIASNECGVPEEIVDKCQSHVSRSVAAAYYIKKDYSYTDNTIKVVVERVFGK
ncbi:MAG: phage integrase SAM-like domain-containing protein [Bacteroidales bacterium]|nr:phage integrase SAM-like domain-containing protein [Bacteroidales bacterium]